MKIEVLPHPSRFPRILYLQEATKSKPELRAANGLELRPILRVVPQLLYAQLRAGFPGLICAQISCDFT